MSRLRKDLPRQQVNNLVELLANHTLSVIQSDKLEPIIITTDNEFIQKLSPKYKKIVLDKGISINHAITVALNKYQASKYLLVMPDLPGLDENTIDKFLHLSSLHEFVICPTEDRGTAMALLPRELFYHNLLGEQSADKIIDKARHMDIPLASIELKELKIDLDDIDDYMYWQNRLKNLIK